MFADKSILTASAARLSIYKRTVWSNGLHRRLIKKDFSRVTVKATYLVVHGSFSICRKRPIAAKFTFLDV